MSNPKELRSARKRADEALRILRGIEGLPRRAGQSVRWLNGVVWTRIGDDEWFPSTQHDWRYPSAHVAHFEYERVDGS